MEQIAVIFQNTYLYWSAVIRGLAAAGAVCCFLALYLGKGGRPGAAFLFVPTAIVYALILGRLAHWYFRPDRYGGLWEALSLEQPGDFALIGVFGGCFLAAALVRLLRLTENLPDLLDCLSIAGAFGICLGRQAHWFNSADRGMQFSADRWFPWVSAVADPATGAAEYRLSVFLLQSAAAGLLFFGLLIWYLGGRRKRGEAALLFLLFYGASQALLDSLRYDALHLRGNGFISPVQLLGAGAMALAAVVFDVRLGWKKRYLILYGMQLGCLGLAGYMEYYVQRHGGQWIFAYSLMGAALAGIVLLTLHVRHLTKKIRGW